MTKEDFITLINVVEGILKIEQGCMILTGCTLEDGEAGKVYMLWDMLRRHTAKRFQAATDLEEDTKNYQAFVDILTSGELTAEEKYEKLIA